MNAQMTEEQQLASEYVLDDVRQERRRQQAKWGEQNHANGTGPNLTASAGKYRYADLADAAKRQTDAHAAEGTLTYLDILLEEFCEAAAEDDPLALRSELVQVAAVAVAWVEKLDRESAR